MVISSSFITVYVGFSFKVIFTINYFLICVFAENTLFNKLDHVLFQKLINYMNNVQITVNFIMHNDWLNR